MLIDYWNSPACLDKIATYATLAMIIAPFLFGIIALIAQNRSKRLETATAERVANEHRAELERVRRDADTATTQLKGALEITERKGAEAQQALTKQLESARTDLNESRSKIGQLEKATAPRVIDAGQRKKLAEALLACKGGKLSIAALLGDAEAIQFAQQLDEAFKSAGWQSSGVSQVVFSGAPVGLILRVQSRDSFHPCTPLVQRALASIGYEASGEVVAGTSVQAVDLVVGKKP